jgi:hypothetical protein
MRIANWNWLGMAVLLFTPKTSAPRQQYMKRLRHRISLLSSALFFAFGLCHETAAGLVGYWPLNDDALDHSVNANDGTLMGNAQYAADFPAAIGSGKSILLDNNGDYVYLGNNGDVSGAYNFTTNDWTISGWLRMNTLTDWVIFANGGNGTGGIRTNLWQENTGESGAAITTDDDIFNPKPEVEGGTITVGTWHHVAATRLGDQLSLYVDGVLVTAQDTGNNPGGFNPLTLPANYDLSGLTQKGACIGANLLQTTGAAENFTDGFVDDVAVFDVALTQAQIQSLVSGTKTPLTVLPKPGDFDGDGDVDGADFIVWQTNFPKEGGATLSQGNADGDSDVDGADFAVWQSNFPFVPTPGASPVPEPSAFFLILAGLGAVCVCRLHRGKVR